MTDITCARCGGVIAYRLPDGAIIATYKGVESGWTHSGWMTCGHIYPRGGKHRCGQRNELEAGRVPAGAA